MNSEFPPSRVVAMHSSEAAVTPDMSSVLFDLCKADGSLRDFGQYLCLFLLVSAHGKAE